MLKFLPIKTRVVHPPKDEIWDILDGIKIRDGDILFITSKILGIHEGRCVKIGTAEKTDLIRREATHHLPYRHPSGFNVNLTITNGVLIPAAGIDESNADGHFVMWPKNPDALCAEIRARIAARRKIKNLGVVATDSHTTPLRWGVTGIAIGVAGVEPITDKIGTADLFNRELHFTKVNTVDALAAMAVLLMGEAAEQTPVCILRGFTGARFNEKADTSAFTIPPELDLYTPLLAAFEKGKGKEKKEKIERVKG